MEYTFAVTALLAIVVLAHFLQSRLSRLPLPPGPRGLPLIGNTLQIPPENAWRQYLAWIKEYGPIVSLNVAGSTIVLIGNNAVAHELLNKRASKTANRPSMIMANDLVTKGMHMLLRPYDVSYRLHQRMQAPVLSATAVRRYDKVFELKTLQMLVDVLNDGPDTNFQRRMEIANLGIVYGLVYGIDIKTGTEKCILDSIRIQRAFGRVSTPGAYIVDTFSFLNYLPRALAPWKREAEQLYDEESKFHLENMEIGVQESRGWTFAKRFSTSNESKEMSQVELAYNLGVLINAGFDTTTMTLEWFVVAILTNPTVLTTAQAHLDEVVGRERLPTLADKENLPYVTAAIEECGRWRNIMNGGFPHSTLDEDTFWGYRIPKGAVLLPQYFAIDHDPAVYSEPDAYDPDRWLDEEGKFDGNPTHVVFGFGRRACPGVNVARSTLWLILARLMWAFDIKKAVGEDGKEVAVDSEGTTGGFNTRALPFKAKFVARGQWVESVVRREWSETDKDIASAMRHMDEP